MKVEQLRSRIGGNMLESIGAGGGTASIPALPDSGGKYRGTSALRKAISIPLDKLMPDPDQPRQEFDPDGLDQLAASLKARGQLQPIRVRWDEGLGKWVVIAGERRYRAALQAGLPTLACIEAKGPLTEDDTLEDQLVENCLREDLKPIEQAKAFKALLQRRGYSYRQLAESLHISHQAIVRALALLDLPEDIQGRVEAGELAPSVAYEVSRLEDSDQQREVAARVVEEELNRAEATEVVRRAAGKSAKPKGRGAGKARKVTFRTSPGPKITVEFRKGLDDELILAALADVMARINATRLAGDQTAA